MGDYNTAVNADSLATGKSTMGNMKKPSEDRPESLLSGSPTISVLLSDLICKNNLRKYKRHIQFIIMLESVLN